MMQRNESNICDINDLKEFSSAICEGGRPCWSLGLIIMAIFNRNHNFNFLMVEIVR